MNRVILPFIMLILPLLINAQQNTYYYKLTKAIINGTINTNVSGGQFITFVGEICFESDKKGLGVGNGKLNFSKTFSTPKFNIYVGESFYGFVTFKFNQNRSILNIIDKNDNIYVYKRQVAPASVLTSSLIKKRENNRLNSERIANTGGIYFVPNNGANINQISNGANSISNSVECNTSGCYHSKTYQKDCHLCLGSGKCRTCNGTHRILNPLTNEYQSCPNCKPDGLCSACGGTGKK